MLLKKGATDQRSGHNSLLRFAIRGRLLGAAIARTSIPE